MKKVLLLILAVFSCFLLVYSSIATYLLISQSKATPAFGDLKCISSFSVARNDPKDSISVLPVEQFTSFGMGIFSGKITNYKIEQRDKFAEQIKVMMKNQQITTFAHLSADICLTNVYNVNVNEGGVILDYQIQHKYCTNSCNTATYSLKVNLNKDGSFIGYSN